MNDRSMDRRQALQTLGSLSLTAAIGPWGRRAVHAEAAEPVPPWIIDTHVHVVHSRLPGGLAKTTALAPFPKEDAEGPQRLAKHIEAEARKAEVAHLLCMPRFEVSDQDPLGIKETLSLADRVPGVKLHAIGLAHPERFDDNHLARVEEVLQQGQVKALKAYLGYLHYEPHSPGYRRYFPLAAKYMLPVIFHTGDTYSRTAKVKYAHPLPIDEIAVDFPENRFVIAHFGNPWLMDAAQVVYKNKNVWADLSGILIGDGKAYEDMEREGVLERVVKRVQEAIAYSEAPERFLFGSDWPLSPMNLYRDFVKRMFSPAQQAAVFRDSAKKLYGI